MSLGLVFKALADETRREILRLLREGDLTAGEIAGRFKVSWPTISHHLGVLKQANLVQDYRRGQHIYYSLNTTVFQEAAAWFLALLEERAHSGQPGSEPEEVQAGKIGRGGGEACRKKIKAKVYALTWETLRPDWPLGVLLAGLVGGAVFTGAVIAYLRFPA